MPGPIRVSVDGTLVPGLTFFEAIKGYVGFDDDATAWLRSFHPLAGGDFPRIIDDFYEAIQSHPGASAAITGGESQIARLKQTLVSWMHELLQGPHDEAYFEKRARIGRVHVRIGLPQSYMLTAMNRIRVELARVANDRLWEDPPRLASTTRAMHQIMDLDLAIMLETYRQDLLARNRTAERLATIGEFAASIGHELRNPLGVIESSAYLLRQHLANDPANNSADSSADPRIARHLDKIATEVRRATTTITELLELARNRAPRRNKVSVRALVQAATSATPLPRDVAVDTVTAPEPDIVIDADRDQLTRVIANLFMNAAQAMGGNGRIVVEASRVGHTTSVRIRDTGPGVLAEVRPRIFEALFTTRATGTGLGLALCRRIVEAHGGTIGLAPADPADPTGSRDAPLRPGACFVIAIPDSGHFDGS